MQIIGIMRTGQRRVYYISVFKRDEGLISCGDSQSNILNRCSGYIIEHHPAVQRQ